MRAVLFGVGAFGLLLSGCATPDGGPARVESGSVSATARSYERAWADRLVEVDPRFSVVIPRYNVQNLPFEEAWAELETQWKAAAGTNELPLIVRASYSDPAVLPAITVDARYIRVAQLILILSKVGAVHDVRVFQQGAILEEIPAIIEDWGVSTFEVTPASQRFLGLRPGMKDGEVTAKLVDLGVQFPRGEGFGATWFPREGQMVLSTYNREVQKLLAVLDLVEHGFEVRRPAGP